MNDKRPAQRRAWQPWLLAALFLGPLAAAWILYFDAGWRPGETTNHGELISPAVPLPAVSLPRPDGSLLGPEGFREHWTLVYVDAGACGEPCRAALQDSRQTRLALGRLMDRVQRVYLYSGDPPAAAFMAEEHPDLLAASLAGPEGARLAASLPSAAEGFWLVDPLGNVMMRYAPDAARKGMLEDLKKLLRISRIG